MAKTPVLKLNRLPLKPIYDAAHARVLAQHLPLSRAPARLIVVPQQLDATTRQQIEARLTRLHNACGCGAGTLALLITLAVWAVMWRMQPDPLAHSATMLTVGLFLAVTSVGVGKWWGLWRAKHTLVAELQHLAQRLETAHATHPV